MAIKNVGIWRFSDQHDPVISCAGCAYCDFYMGESGKDDKPWCIKTAIIFEKDSPWVDINSMRCQGYEPK